MVVGEEKREMKEGVEDERWWGEEEEEGDE